MSSDGENSKEIALHPQQTVRVALASRDFIEVSWTTDALPPKVQFKGCTELMTLMKTMKEAHGPDVRRWPMPEGVSHAEILLRELVLKLQGLWVYPFQEERLCNCRMVATATVDQAIVTGAHTTAVVSRQTSASTNCGTCRPTVQRLIDFRLGKTVAADAKKKAS